MFGFGTSKKVHISAAVRTDTGRVRLNNEDNYYLCGRYREDVNSGIEEDKMDVSEMPMLFAVCDGMGGEEHGELASLLAVQNLQNVGLKNHKKAIKENISKVTILIDDKRREIKAANMGSTLAALYVDSGFALSCNIGDSRVYHMRSGKLKQISLDHSEGRGVLLQYLGVSPDEFILEPYFEKIRLKDKDRFLLCSDGVTDMLSDERLALLLEQEKSSDDIAKDIINAALEAGGKDNATALVVEVNVYSKRNK